MVPQLYKKNAMQLMKLLHTFLKKECPNVHKLRLKNLIDSCKTLIGTNRLSVTGIGRNLPGKVQERSNIRKMDRFVSNKHLANEIVYFYQAMNQYLLPTSGDVWIHVDWTCLSSTHNQYLLRASLTMQGRAIVIYEEPHDKKSENNHSAHKKFLNNLKLILPEKVSPIIVADAGFRAPWFAHVLSLGWHFVGLLRNKNAMLIEGQNQWQLSNSLFQKASSKPQYMGHALLTEKGKTPVEVVLYKALSKNRHKLNINGKPSCSGNSKKYSKAHKEPWVLVTSLALAKKQPSMIVNIYKQRMRIEENFRDTKCKRYGFGLDDSLSQSPRRFRVLLLIAAIANYAAWLSGLFIKAKGIASHFQAQSASTTNALSTVFLGKRALKKGFRLGKRQFQLLLKSLNMINATAQVENGL